MKRNYVITVFDYPHNRIFKVDTTTKTQLRRQFGGYKIISIKLA